MADDDLVADYREQWSYAPDVYRDQLAILDRLEAAERRAEQAECICLVLAPIALPTLVKQARDRIDRNPPRSDGFEDAAAHFAAVLRLRQAMRQLELTA